jgi:hypothetical protein
LNKEASFNPIRNKKSYRMTALGSVNERLSQSTTRENYYRFPMIWFTLMLPIADSYYNDINCQLWSHLNWEKRNVFNQRSHGNHGEYQYIEGPTRGHLYCDRHMIWAMLTSESLHCCCTIAAMFWVVTSCNIARSIISLSGTKLESGNTIAHFFINQIKISFCQKRHDLITWIQALRALHPRSVLTILSQIFQKDFYLPAGYLLRLT